ncbi:unnamed protein product [Chilo suppressalis]|uniref:Rad60/SUMO-like domain-containing protein n=1 Tax=Chilo suppressalis TaxID=168631 RepID=A0ABN8B9M2_CHISP|nr:hypothetical protein evm_001750 [Chilo suppressalis]CAH0404322.1 unnamed protein product [Chilo suppressalis]
MDSSDSEDDCYGNVAQKLQAMKNKYTEDKIDTTNLLNESAELDELLSKYARTPSETAPTASSEVIACGEVSVDNDSEDVLIDTLLASSSKRTTRAAAKRNSSNVSIAEEAPKKQSRRKTVNSNVVTNANVVNTEQCNNQSNRGRGRGKSRGRNRRSRGMWLPTNPTNRTSSISYDLPIYSVGNTHEYPDQSDSQALFSTSSKCSDVVLIEDDELDENEEMSVKVYWQSSEYFKFMIRRFQKLTQIFDYFSKKEGVSNEQLFFTFKDRILKPDDTPDSIDYNIAKFIDGGIIKQSVSKLLVNKNTKSNLKTDGIRIKFQCQNVKKLFETVVGMDEKLSIAMMKCTEYLETTIDRLKFEFDGDPISGKNTPNELNLQEDECIDVKIK